MSSRYAYNRNSNSRHYIREKEDKRKRRSSRSDSSDSNNRNRRKRLHEKDNKNRTKRSRKRSSSTSSSSDDDRRRRDRTKERSKNFTRNEKRRHHSPILQSSEGDKYSQRKRSVERGRNYTKGVHNDRRGDLSRSSTPDGMSKRRRGKSKERDTSYKKHNKRKRKTSSSSSSSTDNCEKLRHNLALGSLLSKAIKSETKSSTDSKTESKKREKRKESGSTCPVDKLPFVIPLPSTSTVPPPPPIPIIPPPPPPPPDLLRNEEIRSSRPRIKNKITYIVNASGDWGAAALNNYSVLNQVGEGTYGQVYKAKKDGVLYALKKVTMDNKEGFPLTAIREIKIIRQLDHANIVRLIGIVTDRATTPGKYSKEAISSRYYMVFEYMHYDLAGLIEAIRRRLVIDFTPLQIAAMFKQLLCGLEYCHLKNIMHRDIKPSNILINKNSQLKIADWGLARFYKEDQQRLYTNRVITLWYRPPELLLGGEYYGPSIDMWSVGCILIELFTKRVAFPGTCDGDQMTFICRTCGTPSQEEWPEIVSLALYHSMRPNKRTERRLKEEYKASMSKVALDLLDKMLTYNPKNRISATDALKSDWISNINIATVQKLRLPENKDFHELWVRKVKKDDEAAKK